MNALQSLPLSKKIKIFSSFVAICILVTPSIAQNVGINANSAAPNLSAILDIDVSAVQGKKKGMLIPRVTELERTQMSPLLQPAQGLVVYQTDGSEGLYYNTSLSTTANWIALGNGSGPLRWDQLQAPNTGLSLAHGANTTNFSFDGLTTGHALKLTTGTLGLGSLLYLVNTSPNIPANASAATLIINRSGANINSGSSSYGMYSSAVNTGINNINIGGFFKADDGTFNYGVWAQTATNDGVGIYGRNSATGIGTQVGVQGSKTASTGTGYGIGVLGTSIGTATENYGGKFTATGGTFNFGVYGLTNGTNSTAVAGLNSSADNTMHTGVSGNTFGNSASGNGIGVEGKATGTGAVNYGGKFSADNAGSNYGVYSSTSSGYSIYGINTSTYPGDRISVQATKTGGAVDANGFAFVANVEGQGVENYAGRFSATGATKNYGVNASAIGQATTNYGGLFDAAGATNNYAVNGASSGTGSANYGGKFFADNGTSKNHAVSALAGGVNATAVYAENVSVLDGAQTGIYGRKTGANGSSTGSGVVGEATGAGTNNFGGRFMASGAASNYGVYGSISQSGVGIYAENSAPVLGIQYGMRAKKTGSNVDGYGVGIQADASGSAQENYGAFFTSAGGGRNYGMKSIASGAGTFNYGGMFTADGATNNYAVYATTIAANGIGIYGENKSTDIGNPIGVYGNKTGSTGLSAGYGVKGNAAGSSLVNHGGYFTSADAQTNYGLRSFATGTGTTNIGGSFYASGATNNYAAIFEAGNVGIGVNAPISALQVKGNLKIFNNATNTHTGLFYNGTADVNGFELYAAANDAYLGLQRNGQYASLNLSKKTGTGDFQAFFINGALVGTISTNGATTSYNTTSDYRLKENIQPTQTGIEDIMNIQVEDYTYKTDPDKSLQTGFLAQDLYKIFPQAVHAGGDDPATDPWTIDYSKLTPMLVKAVQEEQLQIKDLKSEIAGLKNALILANAANEKLTTLTERINKLEKVASQK